jgi:hypothetical protein
MKHISFQKIYLATVKIKEKYFPTDKKFSNLDQQHRWNNHRFLINKRINTLQFCLQNHSFIELP